MNQDEELKQIIRAVIHPTPDLEPRSDLWPRMSQRISSGRRWNSWDWAALAVMTAATAAFPGSLALILFSL
jgi:hypothetical protein